MARNDIAKDGINTRFTSENQPAKRGRPKGSRNRKKIFEELLSIEFEDDSHQAEYLRKAFPDLPKNLSVYELLNMKLIEAGLQGDIKAIKQINEMADGRPRQSSEIKIQQTEFKRQAPRIWKPMEKPNQ